MNPWLYLALAIVLEVGGTTCMKLSEGFTKTVPSILLFVFYLASFGAITLALKQIPLSVAYAIWAGLGTAMVAIIGIMAFGESVSMMKVVSIVLIVVGVAGIHWSNDDPDALPVEESLNSTVQ